MLTQAENKIGRKGRMRTWADHKIVARYLANVLIETKALVVTNIDSFKHVAASHPANFYFEKTSTKFKAMVRDVSPLDGFILGFTQVKDIMKAISNPDEGLETL